jgi:hypothetical protein
MTAAFTYITDIANQRYLPATPALLGVDIPGELLQWLPKHSLP